MKSRLEKYIIKIPNNISVIYCVKKNSIIVIGPLKKKLLKLKLKILLFNDKRLIKVSSLPFFKVSNSEKKKIENL